MATSYIEARLALENAVFASTEALETLGAAGLTNTKRTHTVRRHIAKIAGNYLDDLWLNRDEVTP